MGRVSNSLKIYWKFIRIGPLFVLNLMLILSAVIGGLSLPASLLTFIFSIIGLILVWNFGAIVNDYYDKEIDRISHPDRPVVQEEITPNQLLILAIVHAGVSLCLAFFTGVLTLIYILILVAISILYSIPKVRIKKTAFAPVFIGVFCGMAILIGGSVSSYNLTNLYMALWLAISISLLAPIKDFKDVEGDRAEGVKTLPVLFGVRIATYMIMGFTIIAVVFGVIILEYVLHKMIWSSILAVILGVVTIILLQLHLSSKINPTTTHNITFGLLSLCLLAFFL